MATKGYNTMEMQDDKRSVMTINEAYEKAGVNSCYHIILMISMAIVFMSALFIVHGVDLLTTFPRVLGCPDMQPTSLCPNQTAACARKYAYEDKHANYVSEFDLLCHTSQSELIHTVFNIASLVGSLFAGILGDLFGRVRMLIILTVITFVSLLCTLTVTTYVQHLILLIVCGFCETMIVANCLAFIMDTVHPRNMHVYVLLTNLLYPCSQIISGLLMLSNMRWRYFHSIVCLYSSLFFIFLIWIREPPRFLLAQSRYSEAIGSLRHIARMNGRVLPDIVSIKDEGVVSQQAPGCREKIRLLSKGWLLKRVLPAVYMCCVLSFSYYSHPYNFASWDTIIQYQLIALACVEVVTMILTGLLYPYMERSLLPIAFGLDILAHIGHYFLSEYPILRDVCYGFCVGCMVAMYNVMCIVAGLRFPTAVRSTLTGLITFCLCFGSPIPYYFNDHYTLFIWVKVGADAVGLGMALFYCFLNFEDPEP